MNTFAPYLDLLKREWERLVLAVVVALVLFICGSGISLMLNLMGHERPNPPAAKAPPPLFSAKAFAFLQPDADRIQRRDATCFVLDIPRTTTWKPPKKVDDTPPPPEPPVQQVHQRQSTRPAAPRPKDFLVYHGFMTSASGEPMAYVAQEHDPGTGKRTSKAFFLTAGADIMGMKVLKFTPDALDVQDAGGNSHRVTKDRPYRVPTPPSTDY